MSMVTKNRMLIRDVRGITVATDINRIVHDAIVFAFTSLDLTIEALAIGESDDGNMIYGLIPSAHSNRLPTSEEEAAIGAFVKCSDDNGEYRAHLQLQSKIDSLATQQQRIEDGINAVLAHLGHPVADSIATGVELVESIEASVRRSRHATGAAKVGGKKPSTKRSA